MAIPFHIGDRHFTSKKAAKEAVRKLHNETYQIGDKILPDNSDFEFLLDLLEMHPDATLKIGPGVIGFEIIRTSELNSQTKINHMNTGFAALRTDYSRLDFSYMKIIDGYSLHIDAMRNMVEPVRRTKREMLVKNQHPEDHYSDFGLRYVKRSFRNIAQEFLTHHPEITKDSYTSPDTPQARRVFADQRLVSAWLNFWEHNAEVELYRLKQN